MGRVLVILLLLGLLCNTQSVSAQEAGAGYEGVDVIFLVDQSESMGRIRGGGIPNDPLALRFYSLWYAMVYLGEDHLQFHAENTYRMAVINFGSLPEIWNFSGDPGNPIYWQEIAPISRDEWDLLYQSLSDNILGGMQEDFSNRDLGNTNFADAFIMAKSLFNELPEPPGKRLRVIILLTDGQPYLPEGGFSVSKHMGDVIRFASANFPEPNYRLYVVGMINQNDLYWSAVRSYWEEVTNDPCNMTSCLDSKEDRASIVSNNNEVGIRFQEILQDLLRELPGQQVESEQFIQPGPLVVPPFLKFIAFTYFKTDTSEHLVLADPLGAIDLNREDVSVEGTGGVIEIVRVANPTPGQWSVSTDPPGVDVNITMRQIFAQSLLESPVGEQPQSIPLTIEYALLGDLGQPLPAYTDPLYGLTALATISAGNQTWPLTLSSQSDNVYRATFTPQRTGLHSILVHAESQDLNGNLIVVFEGVIGSFTVIQTTLVNLTLVQPQETEQLDTGLWPFKRIPFVLEVQLLTPEGTPLDPGDIFAGDPNSALTVEVVDQEYKDRSSELLLRPTAQVGIYRAVTDQYGVGEYEIHITGGSLRSGYYYLTPELNFHLSRVPHPLRIPLLVGGSIVVLAILAGLTSFAIGQARSRQHPCRGRIFIVDAFGAHKFNSQLENYGRNRVVFSTKEINPLTHVRRLIVSCLSEQESKDGQVYIDLWLDNDRAPILHRHPLRRGAEVRLGKYSFWLLKDPDFDQLSRERGENIDY